MTSRKKIVGLSSIVVDRRLKHWMYFKTTVHCLPLFFCQARSNSVFIPAYYINHALLINSLHLKWSVYDTCISSPSNFLISLFPIICFEQLITRTPDNSNRLENDCSSWNSMTHDIKSSCFCRLNTSMTSCVSENVTHWWWYTCLCIHTATVFQNTLSEETLRKPKLNIKIQILIWK